MTLMSSMLSTLGMSLDDAAALLGCSRDAVASMSSGRRSMTRQDLKRLRTVYAEISAGRVAGLHTGAAEAAEALWTLRGTDDPPGVVDARPGRRGKRKPEKAVRAVSNGEGT